MRASEPTSETQRLAALKQYDVLDTEPERPFDRLTQFAARLFSAPIALVSLVDAERQWFKSCVGLRIRETGRDIAFCAHAILRDDPLVVPDARADVRFADNPLVTEPPYIRFYAGAPIRNAEGFNLGTLCILDVRPREFGVTERKALADLAALVVDELELRVVSGQLQERSTQLAAALEEMEAQRQELAARTAVLRAVLDSAGEGIVVTDERGQFVLVNAAAQRLGGVNASDLPNEEWPGHFGVFLSDKVTPFPADELPLVRAMRGEACDGVEVYVRNAGVPDGAFLSVTGRPIIDEAGCIGGGVITFHDVTALKSAHEQLALLATTDPLTGLANPRPLRERLEALVSEGARGRRFAVIMADVDHFKRVNDTRGHLVGDEVLVAVAQTLSARVRKTDLVARYGGEEFCIVVTDIDDVAASQVAEKLRAAIESIVRPVSVTASFGVCAYSPEVCTADALISGADHALYKAKHQGRNRVAIYRPAHREPADRP